MQENKVYEMHLKKVYECLVNKAERKGRTKEEVDQIICWLTGYDQKELEAQLDSDVNYGTFFEQAPHYNEKADMITGRICGVQVETIEDPFMKKVRQLDKLVDDGWHTTSRFVRREVFHNQVFHPGKLRDDGREQQDGGQREHEADGQERGQNSQCTILQTQLVLEELHHREHEVGDKPSQEEWHQHAA